MKRKYPAGMFLFGIVTNFLFHFFYLFLLGLIAQIVGIWVKPCLWVGAALFTADLILSVVEQMRIRKAALSTSDDPEFNELMDAFYGPGGPEAFREIIGERIRSADPTDIDAEQE